MQTVTALNKYMREFPDLFEYIDRHSQCDVYSDVDIFGADEAGVERCRRLVEYVETLECYQVRHSDSLLLLLLLTVGMVPFFSRSRPSIRSGAPYASNRWHWPPSSTSPSPA